LKAGSGLESDEIISWCEEEREAAKHDANDANAANSDVSGLKPETIGQMGERVREAAKHDTNDANTSDSLFSMLKAVTGLKHEKLGQMSEEEKDTAKQHDVMLFQPHPKPYDCPVCFVTLPLRTDQRAYKSCCGQTLCLACVEAMREDPMQHRVKGDICPFCKVITTSSNIAELIKKLIRLNDPDAFMVMGSMCLGGMFGQKQDKKKALEWM
jgi:hypothetical protein